METRRTRPGFLAGNEAARETETTIEMTSCVAQKNHVCGICGKTFDGTKWNITPLSAACSDCWNYLYGPIRKSTRDRLAELYDEAESEFSNLRQTVKGQQAETQRLHAENATLEHANKRLRKSLARMYCKEFGILSLYHITSIENVPSILQHGLFCYNQVIKENLSPASCSDPEIQERRSSVQVGNGCANDYVPLFFSEKTPMLCIIQYNNPAKTMVYICVKGEILGEQGVYFSDGNVAAYNTTRIFCALEDLEKLDWDKIRATSWIQSGEYETKEAKRIKAAEVLVPSHVDPKWIEKLIVPNRETEISIREKLPSLKVSIEIKPNFYFPTNSCRHY